MLNSRQVLDKGFEIAASIPGLSRVMARDTGLAMVFHQIIDSRRPYEGTAFCNQLRPDFHEVIEFLGKISSSSTDLWITFDDGYAAAAEALNEVAPRFPNARFVFFVCPEKTRENVGFRWDAWERQNDAGGRAVDFLSFTRGPASPEENRRVDLRETANDDRFRLATTEQCIALQAHSNVYLGNHSNRHIELSTMNAEEADDEIRSSTSLFASMFGSAEHFAFPYGTPGVSYSEGHVELLRSLGYRYIWSTEPLGFRPGSLESITIPRVPVSGLRTASQTNANITKYLLKTKLHRIRSRV